MKICPNCGNQVTDDVLFCNNCGTSVANVAASEPAADTKAEEAPAEQETSAAASSETVLLSQPAPQTPEQNIPFGGAPYMQGQPGQPGMPGMGGQPGMPGQPGFGGPQPFMNNQGNYQQPQYMQPQPQPQVPKFDPSDHTAEFDAEDIKENKLIAVLPYFFFFLGVIVCCLNKESKFARFHMKNAIRLEIASILALLPCIIVIPGVFVTAILSVILVVVYVIAVVNVFKGKAKDLPVIGGIKWLQ